MIGKTNVIIPTAPPNVNLLLGRSVIGKYDNGVTVEPLFLRDVILTGQEAKNKFSLLGMLDPIKKYYIIGFMDNYSQWSQTHCFYSIESKPGDLYYIDRYKTSIACNRGGYGGNNLSGNSSFYGQSGGCGSIATFTTDILKTPSSFTIRFSGEIDDVSFCRVETVEADYSKTMVASPGRKGDDDAMSDSNVPGEDGPLKIPFLSTDISSYEDSQKASGGGYGPGAGGGGAISPGSIGGEPSPGGIILVFELKNV